MNDLNEWLESDLVTLMQQRGGTHADLLPRLELQIDLRIVARWLLSESAKAQAGSEMQCCTYLRAIHVLSTAAQVAAHTQKAGKPTPQQAEAMTKLHDLTFKLGEAKSVKDVDELCRNLALLLSVAAGPLPPGVKELTLMRPAAPRAAGPTTRESPPTLAELSDRVKNIGVSAPLRQQLVELSQAAEKVDKAAKLIDPKDPRLAADPKTREAVQAQHDEAAALTKMLERAVDLADALQKGMAVGDQGRAKMETQLTEGLVLFTDPRLRQAGANRITALDHYRRTVERIRRLNLTPAMQKRLSPAFVWAQEHVDKGGGVIEAVESFLELSARYDGRPAPAGPGAKPGSNEAKVLEELNKQFTADRAAFVDAAAGLGGGAAAGGPEALSSSLDRMRRTLDMLATVEKVPRAVQLLNTYKPKPFGALEKRVNAAIAALADPKPSLAKDEAAKFLPELVKLAGYAGELAGPGGDAPADGTTAAGIPADVVKAYTRGHLPAFDAKRRDFVSDQLQQLATGKELERAKVARLETARLLAVALREAADLEAALRRTDVLVRWADWGIDLAALRAVLEPYKEAVAQSYEAFATDVVPAVPWPTARNRYGPLVDFVKAAAAHADACAAMPTGIVGELSKLVTPLNGQPFAAERFATLAVTAWSRYEQSNDLKNANAAAAAVAASLRQ